MGTQQILLIVLSVIIVGIAVAVGIQMFNQQAINSARNSIIGDMNNFSSQAQAWYKTPTSMGGAGGSLSATASDANGIISLAEFMGFDASAYTFSNDNGTYTLSFVGTTGIRVRVSSPGETQLTRVPIMTLTPSTGAMVISYEDLST